MNIEDALEKELSILMPLVDKAKIHKLRLGEPPWDSLRHLEIINAVERRFKIEISVDEAISAVDFARLLGIVISKFSSTHDTN